MKACGIRSDWLCSRRRSPQRRHAPTIPELVDDTDVVLYEYQAVRVMEPQGPAFNRGLRSGYLDYSDLLYDDYDMVDFGHFAFKAVDSAKGENVLPDRVEVARSRR